MHLRVLPSAFQRIPVTDNLPPSQPLTTFQVTSDHVEGMLAIDGGSLGLVGEPADMAKYRDVLLTHAHIDHIATLPMWIEALLSQGRAPVPVHATTETIAALREHFFNDVIFPNFEKLTEEDGQVGVALGVFHTFIHIAELLMLYSTHIHSTCKYRAGNDETHQGLHQLGIHCERPVHTSGLLFKH